jgi:type I restriction enzyme M protein
MFEQAFKNIDDVLRKEAGCTTELDYTEQTSWLLFLKYLDGLEQDRADEAALDGKKYTYILDQPYRWETWASPKGKDGKLDHNIALTGDDLRDFVNQKLFPYLNGFKQKASGSTPSNTRSGRSSQRLKTRSPTAITCVRSSTTSTNSVSARRPRSTNCPTSTRPRSRTWATPGATAASITLRVRSSVPSCR